MQAYCYYKTIKIKKKLSSRNHSEKKRKKEIMCKVKFTTLFASIACKFCTLYCIQYKIYYIRKMFTHKMKQNKMTI